MASTFSSALNLELQASGENSGTWGVITNNNLQKVESAIKGYVSIAIASTSDSLATSDGSTTDEQSNAIIRLTGTLTGNTTMQSEAVETWYIVDDATTHGGNTLGFKPAGGTAVNLVEGAKHILYSDGSTMFDVLADAGNVKANGTLTVSGNTSLDGGTFVFNESSADLDFRIETDDQTHALFIDGANDRFHLFNSSTSLVSNSSDVFGVEFVSGGSFTVSSNGSAPLDINRQNNDGTLVNLHQEGNGEGTISVSGSTVSYNTFCGAHWSRLADNSKPTILRGTVIESIATMMTWYQLEYQKEDGHTFKEPISLPNGKSVGDTHTITIDGVSRTGKILKEDNEQLPMCKISDTEDSKAIYGVFLDWDDNDDGSDGDVNDMHVASLGAFVVRIHKDETVAIGDYLQSKGDGTAKKQADDILRASTVGKVTSTEKIETYSDGSYCVPCTLHCG